MDILADDGLKLWGGLECTRNRVGDAYFDQFARSGHRDRISDLDLVAELGIKVLRYPALWEWAQTADVERWDWDWIDQRQTRLRQLGIRPIVGFVHHGSGPPDVDLLSEGFATGLERYASAFASRFPWIDAYTPVNEPLTTARFSALYGHWYPHKRDSLACAVALLNQCKAVVLAMQAVRRINPAALLIQTEDLGKTHCSPLLQYQADFENTRRWITFDLLCGHVDQHHPIGNHFLWLGVERQALQWFIDHPLRPDVLGLNYYVTSERYLDEQLDRYPASCHGGNGKHRYADVEAVRGRTEGLAGVRTLLTEAWDRFHQPLAITEAHLGCSREDQLRWLWEIWSNAKAAKADGVDIRAVTAWSLFGAYDWNSLVTESRGHYESGVFDIRGPRPRPTAISTLVRELATDSKPSHPVLADSGWWRRNQRLLYQKPPQADEIESPSGPPIVILHQGDALGRAFVRSCENRGLAFAAIRREDVDFTKPKLLNDLLCRTKAWAVIHTSDHEGVEEAEHNPSRNHERNVREPANVALACHCARVPLLTFSSGLVFDGTQRIPYVESDAVNPICAYGRAKAEAEDRILDVAPSTLVIRLGAYVDLDDESSFVTASCRAVQAGQAIYVDPSMVSLTYLPEIAHTGLDLLIDGAAGIWHVAGDGAVTWRELALQIGRQVDPSFDEAAIRDLQVSHLPSRPYNMALSSEKGIALSPWQVTLARYLNDHHTRQINI